MRGSPLCRISIYLAGLHGFLDKNAAASSSAAKWPYSELPCRQKWLSLCSPRLRYSVFLRDLLYFRMLDLNEMVGAYLGPVATCGTGH